MALAVGGAGGWLLFERLEDDETAEATEAEHKLYVWPFAFTRKASTLSPEERQQLAEAIGEDGLRAYEQLGDYLGYRAAIDEDGNWVFYVAGD